MLVFSDLAPICILYVIYSTANGSVLVQHHRNALIIIIMTLLRTQVRKICLMALINTLIVID